MTRYTAVCRRSGDWWAISVPELRGVHTQARRLDRVEAMARDAIALMLDVAPDSFAVEVRPEVPREVARAQQAREKAKVAGQRATEALNTAAQSLISHGYTVRDAGRLLGLSPQRVSQIVTASHATASGKSAAHTKTTKSASSQPPIARTARRSATNTRTKSATSSRLSSTRRTSGRPAKSK